MNPLLENLLEFDLNSERVFEFLVSENGKFAFLFNLVLPGFRCDESGLLGAAATNFQVAIAAPLAST